MPNFIYTHELEGKEFTASAKRQIQLLGLPAGQVVRFIMLELDSVLSNSTGAPISVTSRELVKLIANIDLDTPRFTMRANGKQLWAYYRAMMGKSLTNTAYTVPANGTLPARAFLMIPFFDTRSVSPGDFEQPCELLERHNIEITCANSATIKTGLTVSQCLFRSTCFFGPGKGGVLPAKVKLNYADWGGQTANLDMGVYSDLFIIDEADDAVAVADVSKIRVRFDGNTIVDNLPTEQLVSVFNHEHAMGGSVNDEQLPDDQFLFLPILTAPKGYKLTKLPGASSSARADITGSLTQPRFVYRVVEPTTSAEDSADIAKVAGIPATTAATTPRVAKTASKVAVQGNPIEKLNVSSILPKKFPSGLIVRSAAAK